MATQEQIKPQQENNRLTISNAEGLERRQNQKTLSCDRQGGIEGGKSD